MFPEPRWLLVYFLVLSSVLAIGTIASLRRPDKEIPLARKDRARSIRVTCSILAVRAIFLVLNVRAWSETDYVSLALQAAIFGNLSFVLAYEISRWRATRGAASGAEQGA